MNPQSTPPLSVSPPSPPAPPLPDALAAWTHNLAPDARGIWRPHDAPHGQPAPPTAANSLGQSASAQQPEADALSYPTWGHDSCAAIEDSSFWFAHRNRCITALVQRVPPPEGGPIFDVGGGNGVVAAALAAADHPVVLVEPGEAGARNAKARGIEQVICGPFDDAHFVDGTVPAVGMFDVLEHIADDLAMLSTVFRKLRGGGTLYVTVPASAALWSAEDVVAGHFRRYSRQQARSLLAAAGFDVVYAGHCFVPLPLPIFLLRRAPYLLNRLFTSPAGNDVGATPVAPARHHHGSDTPQLRIAVERLLAAECSAIRRGWQFPVGATCILAARKPTS